jgi:hypothetical protein
MRLDSVDAYRRQRERVHVPIAVGETFTGMCRFKSLLDVGALDVTIVDPGWTGGPVGSDFPQQGVSCAHNYIPTLTSHNSRYRGANWPLRTNLNQRCLPTIGMRTVARPRPCPSGRATI